MRRGKSVDDTVPRNTVTDVVVVDDVVVIIVVDEIVAENRQIDDERYKGEDD